MRLLVATVLGMLSFSVNSKDVDVQLSLTTGDYATLESHFGDLESRFDQRQISERELVDAFRPFYKQTDVLSAKFDDWVKKAPTSYNAVLARGIYHRKLGEFGRGRKPVGQTSEANLQYMHQQLIMAMEDFRRAQLLRPGTYLVAVNMLNVAQFEGDAEEARKAIDAANKAFPQNFMARARYLTTLKPRWGGSQARMSSFIEESGTKGASDQQVRWLKAIQLEDLASDAFGSGDRSKVRGYLVDALRLSADADSNFRDAYLEFAAWYCFGPQRQDESSCQPR